MGVVDASVPKKLTLSVESWTMMSPCPYSSRNSWDDTFEHVDELFGSKRRCNRQDSDRQYVEADTST